MSKAPLCLHHAPLSLLHTSYAEDEADMGVSIEDYVSFTAVGSSPPQENYLLSISRQNPFTEWPSVLSTQDNLVR